MSINAWAYQCLIYNWPRLQSTETQRRWVVLALLVLTQQEYSVAQQGGIAPKAELGRPPSKQLLNHVQLSSALLDTKMVARPVGGALVAKHFLHHV